MNSYNNRGGNRGGYGGGNRGGYGGGRDSGPREMHQATCDECGNSCEVPFRPSGNKPVYCSNCFETKGGGDSRDSRGSRGAGQRGPRGGSGGGFEKKDDTNKKLLEQVSWLNSKLDRVLKVLETGVKTDAPKKKDKKVKPKVSKAKATPKKKVTKAKVKAKTVKKTKKVSKKK